MPVDYPGAEEHFVPRSFMFNSNNPIAVVIHKTGGDATPQDVYNTFINSGNPGKSAHYAIGQDGALWQYVPEALGAGANGIPGPNIEAFWQPYLAQYGNLNMCTVSVEHCDPSSANDTPLTDVQKRASFQLVAHLCQKYGLAADRIRPHRSIASTDCPGTYPMDELINYVKGGTSMQVYSPQASDFSTYFTATDADHWLCKQTGKTVQYGILHFYSKLSIDGNTLPVIGLPLTDEIYLTINGKPVVLAVFERAGVYNDASHVKDNQPGTLAYSLCHLTDLDFLKNIPGFTPPVQPTIDVAALIAAVKTLQAYNDAAANNLLKALGG